MSNVVRLQKGTHAELHGGILTSGPHAGEPIYFVDLVDVEGGRLGVWDGHSYDAARDILAECRRDGMRTVDLLGEAL